MSKKEVIIKNQDHGDVIDQSWSEVDDIYNVIAESILEIAAKTNALLQQARLMGLDADQELIITTAGLNRDLLQFTSDLKAIHSRHVGKSGTITTEEDYVLSCEVFSEYVNIQDKFKIIVFNPLLTITEKLSMKQAEVQNV